MQDETVQGGGLVGRVAQPNVSPLLLSYRLWFILGRSLSIVGRVVPPLSFEVLGCCHPLCLGAVAALTGTCCPQRLGCL